MLQPSEYNSSLRTVFWWCTHLVSGVFDKLWYLLHHADLQAARLIQSQHRVAGPGEPLPECPQQTTTVRIVEGQTPETVVQEDAHSLRGLSHEHTGLNGPVEHLEPTAAQKQEDSKINRRNFSDGDTCHHAHPDGVGEHCKHHDMLFSPTELLLLAAVHVTPSL